MNRYNVELPRWPQGDSLRQVSFVAAFFLSAISLTTQVTATSLFIEWTSAAAGSGGGIDATVDATITRGEIVTIVHPANDPNYVADFDADHSALAYGTGPSGPADIESTITFSAPLPVGSRLIALDLDQNVETFTLLSGGVPLTLLAQVESRAGESSIFPSWNTLTGDLVAQTTAPALNDNEASIFEASGLTAITVNFRNGGPASGSGLAIALPIPEPATGLLLALGILLLKPPRQPS